MSENVNSSLRGRASVPASRRPVKRGGIPKLPLLGNEANLAFPTHRLDRLAGTLALPDATPIQLHSTALRSLIPLETLENHSDSMLRDQRNQSYEFDDRQKSVEMSEHFLWQILNPN
jgi:hypothetical protein